MPSGNGARAAQKRERNQAKAAQQSQAKSQLKTNQQALTVVCNVCRQTFLQTSKEGDFRAHHQAKHDKLPFTQCFPNYSS